MTHTQGPWHIENHPNSVGGSDWHHIKNGNGTSVVAVSADYLNDEANARLIAAAPELLSALQHLMSQLPQNWGDQVIGGDVRLLFSEQAIDNALEAIDKATNA